MNGKMFPFFTIYTKGYLLKTIEMPDDHFHRERGSGQGCKPRSETTEISVFTIR